MRLFLGVLLFWLASPLAATSIDVRVLDGAGRPVRDAVVTLRPAGRPAPSPRAAGKFVVEQRNLQFHPFVSIVPVGGTVTFPNFDATRHHVYSFSSAKRFEFKLFARDQSRSIRVDQPGTIAVGCNIHDQMSAFVFVTDTVWTARTDARGVVSFRDAPPGLVSVAVWHPFLRAPGGTVARQVALSSAPRTETFAVGLRPPPMHDMGGY
jgi:plastocyanin